MRLARDFMVSRMFLTAAELDIFTLLAGTALSAGELAFEQGWNPKGLGVLCDSLASCGFLEKREGKYATRHELVPLLSQQSASSIVPMLKYTAWQWNQWSELANIVRGVSPPPAELREADEQLKLLVRGMHRANSQRAFEIANRLRPLTGRRLLDVGGGAGIYSLALLQAVPEMRATIVDFPSVLSETADIVKASGMSHRVSLVGADYLRDDLPGCHDLALVSAVAHQHDAAGMARLFAKVHDALAPSGRIVIRGFIMAEDKTEPKAGALFALNLLATTKGGGTYSFDETRRALEMCGFHRARIINDTGDMSSLIDAVKP